MSLLAITFRIQHSKQERARPCNFVHTFRQTRFGGSQLSEIGNNYDLFLFEDLLFVRFAKYEKLFRGRLERNCIRSPGIQSEEYPVRNRGLEESVVVIKRIKKRRPASRILKERLRSCFVKSRIEIALRSLFKFNNYTLFSFRFSC